MKFKIITFFIIVIILVSYYTYNSSYHFLYGMSQRVKSTLQKQTGNYITLSEISPFVPEAAIASQDERFYTNSGIDAKGTVRAIYYSITTGRRQGASTITEQLIKNVYFNDVDNLKTDILTKILAVITTTMYSKGTILELYLNSIYYGHQSFGVGKAARYYFNKSAGNLTLEQSAYLIALINAPSYLSQHNNQAIQLSKTVLQSMVREKNISQFQADEAGFKLKP